MIISIIYLLLPIILYYLLLLILTYYYILLPIITYYYILLIITYYYLLLPIIISYGVYKKNPFHLKTKSVSIRKKPNCPLWLLAPGSLRSSPRPHGFWLLAPGSGLPPIEKNPNPIRQDLRRLTEGENVMPGRAHRDVDAPNVV